MRKSFITSILLAVVFLSFLSFVNWNVVQAIEIPNPLKAESFEELINSIIDFLFTLALALTPLMIIVGAYYFLTSAGDPNQVNTAKKIILYTLIGFLIIFMARGLIKFLTETFLKKT